MIYKGMLNKDKPVTKFKKICFLLFQMYLGSFQVINLTQIDFKIYYNRGGANHNDGEEALE